MGKEFFDDFNTKVVGACAVPLRCVDDDLCSWPDQWVVPLLHAGGGGSMLFGKLNELLIRLTDDGG